MKNPNTIATPAVLTEQSIDKMLGTIRIPPRPSLLFDVQQELAGDEPSPRKLAAIIGHDVAMSGALLKLANSSFIGLRLQAKSVEQAVMRLGMEQCSLLLTGLLARATIHIDGFSLTQFWDESSKRARAMSFLAKKMTLCRNDIAHTAGLFCNIGVPLLLIKFPDYYVTMESAISTDVHSITARENAHFSTNHAALGALLARTWGLPGEVVDAILLHHQFDVLQDANTDSVVRNLIALALLVDYGIHRYHSQTIMSDWEAGGTEVCAYLGISQNEVDNISDQIHDMFQGD